MSYQRATTRFIPDSVQREPLSTEFDISTFQTSLRTWIKADLRGVNFWDMVVFDCTNGHIPVCPADQKLHLYEWIKSNWTWFTESFSNRERYYLTQKLRSLNSTKE